jgi:hypothetical protein
VSEVKEKLEEEMLMDFNPDCGPINLSNLIITCPLLKPVVWTGSTGRKVLISSGSTPPGGLAFNLLPRISPDKSYF